MRELWGVAAIAALFFFGCASPSIKQVTDPNVFYRRDFRLTVNGKQGLGVVVAGKAPTYQVDGVSRGDLNLLSVRSCHREVVKENLPGKSFSYNYLPVSDMETEDMCPLMVGGFDSKNGQHSWGAVIFEDPNGVTGYAACNGESSFGQTTACQSPAGLEQQISFDEEMAASPDAGECSFDGMPKRGKTFRYVMPRRECVLAFVSVSDGGKRTHKHFTIGYESILLRDQ